MYKIKNVQCTRVQSADVTKSADNVMLVRSFSRRARIPALVHLSEQLNCTNWQRSTNCRITGLTDYKSSAPSWMLSTCNEFLALTTEKLTDRARLLSTTIEGDMRCMLSIYCLFVCLFLCVDNDNSES